MILQMWESEPIKVVLGVEILIFWILLIGWGFASWRLKVKESRLGKTDHSLHDKPIQYIK